MVQLASRLRCLSARSSALSLVLVSLGSFSGWFAPASGSASGADGTLTGRYRVVSPRATTLIGRVDTRGAAALEAEGILIGPAESGALHARFVEIEQEPGSFHLEYDVVGQYVRGLDGIVRIEAQIYLDLISQGVPLYLHAGELQGRLSRQIEREEDPNGSDPAQGGFAARIDWL
jgi:hypothetical protein